MSNSTSNERATIIVISPHPDDLEIGMGGTVAKYAAAGTRVISLVLTDGRRSPRAFQCSDDEMAAIRKQEVIAAAKILAIDEPVCLGLADIRAAEHREQAQQALLDLTTRYRPSEIYLPHPGLDRHESHRLGAQLCLDLLSDFSERRPESAPQLWAYEVWGLFPSWQRVEDISQLVEQKIAAINAHESQVKDVAYAEGVIGLNRWRAVFTDPHSIPDCRYLEAFIRLE